MSNPISHQPMTASINQHHVHRDDEPLPGAKGGQPAVDYSPETIDHTKLPISEEGNTQDFTSHTKAHHNERANQEPVGAGLGGGESRTLGDEHMSGNTPKPGLGDKVVGKTQELTGKILKKEPLKEKGELRQQGEKV
ncbi:hypothetical protein CVT26_000145 [Gymnopilus dilepis]|uniref:Uncharacterized protein n=1 Tax=Gymnopilus dilepis TaxID=231916 RepID=A0A409WE48_9AGAR|nr:hypothetical protein CVT26_000145 [Gymnopilus dilepis]